MEIHLIPNSHMDPVWLWDKYEGIDEVINTFSSACDRLDEYPELTFSASSLQFYKWVKKYDDDLFERIKTFVKAGRWEITGGWWVEPDTNLPFEISFKKHAELSKKFMMENFGSDTKVAFLPDTFGHPATLPKILSEAGFKYFIFCRPSVEENDKLPSNLFYWEYKGHKVLAYRLKNHYTQNRQINVINDYEYNNSKVNGFFFGVGNHGGGPSVIEIEYYKKLIHDNSDIDMNFSTCRAFFEDVEKNIENIPVFSGDLHMHAVGCYSILRGLKQKIRSAEYLLQKTERIAPNLNTEPLWEKVLFNQFHDILPGSCSKKAEENAINEVGGIIAGCKDLIYDELKTKTMKVKQEKKAGDIKVFNSLPYDIIKPVQIEFSNLSHERSNIYDSDGNIIEKQEMLPETRTLFTKKWEFVDTIPARSFKSYFFDINPKKEDSDKQLNYFEPNNAVGDFLDSKISFLVFEDDSDTWSHGIQKYDRLKGKFQRVSSFFGDGTISKKVHVEYSFEGSEISLVSSRYKNLPGYFIDVTVNWAETCSVLKMEFDIINPKPWIIMNCAGGAVKRAADGVEQPLHNWIWCPEKDDYGLALIQDGAFACDYSPGKLRVNLVRSNLYGFHDPYIIGEENPQHHTDLGVHNFRFHLLPGVGVNEDCLNKSADIFLEELLYIN